MEDNLSLLVHTLVKSKNIIERIEISKMIFDLLDSSMIDFDKNELALRQLFITHLKVCAVCPNTFQSILVTKIAHFYDRKYIRLLKLSS